MTTVAEHVHEVAEYHRVLDLSWCACGSELKHGRWREPRTSAGKLKRYAWETAAIAGQRG